MIGIRRSRWAGFACSRSLALIISWA